jgi:RNA polymerase sigma-70 factor (sigma-E family)
VDDSTDADFGAFVARRQASLLRFAMVLTGNGRLAEDIVADVLARAYERWDRIGPMAAPQAYVRRMVVNDYLSWRRRLRRTVPVAEIEDRPGPDRADGHDERADLHDRLARLPARQRACVVLRFYEDLPDEEIADVLGCAVGTVRSSVSRALARLRVDLVDRAGHPMSTALPKES